MARVIYGTIVARETAGTTASGNPITDVRIDPANGDAPGIYRVSHDAALTYDVENHYSDGEPRAYVLTDAGRVSHEDIYATSAYRRLLSALPRGAEATTVVTHVSSSGMSRRFRVLGVDTDSRVDDVTLAVARVLGWEATDRGELVVRGAGMDMGFHTVYTLASRLYGDGYALNHRGL